MNQISRQNSNSGDNFNLNGDFSMKQKLTLAVLVLGIILAVVGSFSFLGIKTIEGNERAVVQDWKKGVLVDLWNPGTHFYIPATTTPYAYHVGAARFILGNGEGADVNPLTVTTGGEGNEQPATFHATLQYHLDDSKLVKLHNHSRYNYEQTVIKPALTRIISDQATVLEVLSFYSGAGRMKLQNTIERAIMDEPSLAEVGIIVDTFVFYKIVLDPKYVDKIRDRQLAYQDKLKNIEEAKAAVEAAKKAEALAEADKLKRIVAAEASAAEQVKAAEAQKEKRILAAQAQAKEIREKASAERYRKEQDAKGLLAQGLAEARVAEEKKTSKYSGTAGARQASVEIEQARVGLFKNMAIKGVITEKTALTIINGGATKPLMTLPVTNK